MDRTDASRPSPHDPLARRLFVAVLWCGAYGLLWYFHWKPLPPYTWVNGAIIAAILLGTLPPERFRNFTAAFGYVTIAVIIQLIFHQTLAAIVLTLLGALAFYNGLAYLQQARRRG
ncbi:MAG: hypothetical protein DYG94_08545 [Leptolyngbya sp. PLA3]|nr:MAG: hypothetical protein EDM82_07155 [Cyanobacteria bacterium CYA]MCE7968780.1 hypothetical protein [Leptolyngbya sp. PL-A3]